MQFWRVFSALLRCVPHCKPRLQPSSADSPDPSTVLRGDVHDDVDARDDDDDDDGGYDDDDDKGEVGDDHGANSSMFCNLVYSMYTV